MRSKFSWSNAICWLATSLVAAIWLALLWRGTHKELWFDDSFMFYRYAMHVRHGLGVSWNLDGVHTYGQTAPLWSLAVLLLSFLPATDTTDLVLGSWLCSIAALLAMAWTIWTNTKSEWMRSFWRVFPVVAFPLAVKPLFLHHIVTGMETMLGAALCAAYVGMVMLWQRGLAAPELAGAIGVLLFLTRPEAALVVVLFPLCVRLLTRGGSWSGLARLLAVAGCGIALDLLLCRLYFGTALPLSFYMKSRHAYQGSIAYLHPGSELLDFLVTCLPFLLVHAAVGRARDARLVLAFAMPPVCLFAYLSTVTQIMGFWARYYMPYLAFVVVPAVLVLDRRIAEWSDARQCPASWSRAVWIAHAAAVAVLLVVLASPVHYVLAADMDRHLEGQRYGYVSPQLEMAAKKPLPEQPWWDLYREVADYLVAPLPPGSTVASSEVGYLGARAPEINIIDLAGLNDNEIAMHGFSVSSLLARKPDLIWLPHTDYTYQLGEILSDPEFLREYEVFGGAANSGLAIRKDSPRRAQLEASLQSLWQKIYPGTSMESYRVTSVSWTQQKYAAVDRFR